MTDPEPKKVSGTSSQSARVPGGDAPREKVPEAVFDGVVCFGGADWWYHNRGHYDLRMCGEMSKHVPVLYVNSLGVRTPSLGEGGMFFVRVKRKLKSWMRGFVRVEDAFGVVSPISVPGPVGRKMSGVILRRQIRSAMKKMKIRRPLVWVECPSAADYVDAMKPVGVVYQRTDRWEEFPGVDRERVGGFDRWLKDRADATLFCSSLLFEREGDACRCAAFVDHGVDVERFDAALGGMAPSEPEDLADIPRPRVGFVGGIDDHTFDPQLFEAVVKQRPDDQFVMVGSSSLGDDWNPGPNVHLLGQRPLASVASYMVACDVLIMPWNDNDWIAACNPVKLKEYLAAGKPIVTTGFYELKNYEGLVRVATDADSFAEAIGDALAEPGDVAARRAFVRGHSWSAKIAGVLRVLADAGIGPRSTR